MHQVVVVGGGIAGAECLLALSDLAPTRARLTLVTPQPEHPIEALAPAAAFGLAEPQAIPIARLCEHTSATWVRDAMAGIDPDRRSIRLASDATLPYESAVLALGATPAAVTGADLTYRGYASHAEITALVDELRRGSVRSVGVVVPMANGWTLPAYELALLLAGTVPGAHVTVWTPEPEPLAAFGAAAVDAISRELAHRRVGLRTSVMVAPAADGTLEALPGEPLRADRIVAVAASQGPAVDGLLSTSDGFLVVDERQVVKGANGVYAVGDCAAGPVKQGGIATRQADAAAAAIARALGAVICHREPDHTLRGKLVGGPAPLYLRQPGLRGEADGQVSDEELWRPSSKVWGHYLPRWLEFAQLPA